MILNSGHPERNDVDVSAGVCAHQTVLQLVTDNTFGADVAVEVISRVWPASTTKGMEINRVSSNCIKFSKCINSSNYFSVCW